MIKNMTVTVTFSNNTVRVWGYDTQFFADEEAFLTNVSDDFSDKLKNILYATVTILKEDNTIDTFVLDSKVKSDKYKNIIQAHIDGTLEDA